MLFLTKSIDFRGRNLREVNFAESPQLKIGGFDALDFFGDGSFYLLNTPGHDIGHISGLVRTTTSPDTFIFMGGDLCHHGGEIRPSPYNPIPDKVHLLKPEDTWVSGQLFKDINVQRSRKEDQAMFDPSSKVVADFAAAVKTIRDTQVADADENVFFVFAHDTSVGGVVDLFPLPANDWKAKGWREKARWGFLADLMPAAGGAISEVE
jgi:glyoxylase-like metal-dependent hydrolase (beta-lactamase superfamily II)